jgi:hypothetical protein
MHSIETVVLLCELDDALTEHFLIMPGGMWYTREHLAYVSRLALSMDSGDVFNVCVFPSYPFAGSVVAVLLSVGNSSATALSV